MRSYGISILGAVLLLAGCSKTSPLEQQIAGTYLSAGTSRLILNHDHSYIWSNTSEATEWVSSGQWSSHDSTLELVPWKTREGMSIVRQGVAVRDSSAVIVIPDGDKLSIAVTKSKGS